MTNSERGALAAQIKQLEVGYGQIALWALGQHGFVVKSGDHTLVIDPYLSDAIEASNLAMERLIPIVIAPDELSMVNTILVTHQHRDHCDPDTLGPLLNAAPHARLIGPYAVRDELEQHGVDLARITVPPIDQSIVIDDELAIKAIPSAHYEHEPDAAGNPAYLGFVITLGGVTLYHSGDTIIYPGLLDRLHAQPIDLACLPINGRDWFREHQNLVGNLDYREAADLAAEVGVKVLIPAHNDLFAGNRINPAYLLDYLGTHHPRQRVHFLQAGELYLYAG